MAMNFNKLFLSCLVGLLGSLMGCAVSPVVATPNVGGLTQQATLPKPVVREEVPRPAPLPPQVKPVADAPSVSSAAAIVYNPRDGKILFEKNAWNRRAVASTQKLVTAILAVEHGVEKSVTVPKEATSLVPSKLYLRPGTQYELAHLVNVMMVKSANDVAYTIGHGIAGSNANFLAAMNAKARSLGMYNSNFMNSHGLTVANQYSTAYDIALLGAAAYRHPFIRKAASTKEMTFHYADGRTKQLVNTNQLLGKVEFCDGMKTGTTRAAGNCLVSSGTVDGETRIVVVLGASSKTVLWKESEALLRWAVAN